RSGENSRERVAENDDPADRNARHGGRPRIGSGSQYLPAKHRIPEENVERSSDAQCNKKKRRDNRCNLHLAECPDLGGQGVERHRLGEDEHGAGKQIGACQSNNEAVDTGSHDGKAIEPSESSAENKGAQDPNRYRQAENLKEVTARHYRTDADRTNSEIHPAGRQYHHLGETDHDIDRKRATESEEVEGRQETWGEAGKEDPKHNHDREQSDPCRSTGK